MYMYMYVFKITTLTCVHMHFYQNIVRKRSLHKLLTCTCILSRIKLMVKLAKFLSRYKYKISTTQLASMLVEI